MKYLIIMALGSYFFVFCILSLVSTAVILDTSQHNIDCDKKYRIEYLMPSKQAACWLAKEVEL